MGFGRRWLTRTLAAVLLLLGGMGLPAPSASAATAGPDLTVDLVGGTIPLGVTKKTMYLRITNKGDQTPTEVLVNVDPSELTGESQLVTLWPIPGIGECDGDMSGWYCRLVADDVPGPGETVEMPVHATVQTRKPLAGRIKVTLVATPADTEPTDNTAWFPVSVVDRPEADLSVVVPDVKRSVRIGAGGSIEPAGPLTPGGTGAVRYTIANQGLKPVSGVTVALRLPAGVTFTEPPAECVLGDAGRSAVCTYDRLALIPADQDTDPDDALHSAVELHHLVTVSAATKAPVTVGGGTVRVEGLSAATPDAATPARAALPANAVAVRAADVDDSDNQDGFAVVVAAKSSGGGTGSGNGDHGSGGNGSGNGEGGGLPITGPPAGPTAGIGLALLAAGSLLLLATRRRRAVR